MQTERGKTIAAILGLTLVAAVLIMLMSVLPRPSQDRDSQNQQADTEMQSRVLVPGQLPAESANPDQIASSHKEERKTERPVGWVTKENLPDWVMAVITFVGLWIAIVQISHAKDAVLKTERADVLIETVGFITPKPLTHASIMQITLRNYGRTRANDLVVNIWQGMSASDKLEERPLQVTNLGAGASVRPRFPSLSSCLSLRGFEAVMSGEATFEYGGTVTYKDVFGQSHTLRTSGVYDLESGAFLIEENTSD